MNGHVATLDSPDAVASLEVVLVRSADHLHHVITRGAHAVDVADAVRVILAGERHLQIAGEVMRFAPHRPQHFLDGLLDAGMAVECAERRSDVSDAVFPPDAEKTAEVSAVEGAAISGDEIPHRIAALELIDALHQEL